jgi:hypothetical protein
VAALAWWARIAQFEPIFHFNLIAKLEALSIQEWLQKSLLF